MKKLFVTTIVAVLAVAMVAFLSCAQAGFTHMGQKINDHVTLINGPNLGLLVILCPLRIKAFSGYSQMAPEVQMYFRCPLATFL